MQADATAAERPLTGTRVIDLGWITAGAGTSAILADLGADVIKVEGPGSPDPFRMWEGGGARHGLVESLPLLFLHQPRQTICLPRPQIRHRTGGDASAHRDGGRRG